MRHLPIFLLLPFLLSACGNPAPSPTDRFGAFNPMGGAERNNDFSMTETSPASTLTIEAFPPSMGGFRTPPLDIDKGRQVMLFSGAPGKRPVVAAAFRDSILWRFSLPPNDFPLPSLAADSSGTIYISSTRGYLYAIAPDGQFLWRELIDHDSTDTTSAPTPPLALGNGAVVGNGRGVLVRFHRSGRKMWSIRRGAAFEGRPCARPDIGIVAALSYNDYSRADSILVVDPASGAERWSRPAHGRIVAEPIIARNRIVMGVAVSNQENQRVPGLIAFRPDGQLAWIASLPLLPRGLASGADGVSYASCAGNARDLHGGALVAIDSGGKRRWLVPLGSGIVAPVSVTANWIYFIARREGRTGLYSYLHDGSFGAFVPIDILPDVLSLTTVSTLGRLVLSGLDQPVLLTGG